MLRGATLADSASDSMLGCGLVGVKDRLVSMSWAKSCVRGLISSPYGGASAIADA